MVPSVSGSSSARRLWPSSSQVVVIAVTLRPLQNWTKGAACRKRMSSVSGASIESSISGSGSFFGRRLGLQAPARSSGAASDSCRRRAARGFRPDHSGLVLPPQTVRPPAVCQVEVPSRRECHIDLEVLSVFVAGANILVLGIFDGRGSIRCRACVRGPSAGESGDSGRSGFPPPAGRPVPVQRVAGADPAGSSAGDSMLRRNGGSSQSSQ